MLSGYITWSWSCDVVQPDDVAELVHDRRAVAAPSR